LDAQHVVVDTDIFIWLTRGKKEAVRYAPLVSGKRIVVSFATVAELWRGAHTQGYGESSKKKLEADIGLAVVVPPTSGLTHEWARISSWARSKGHALGQKSQAHDAWVAATAIYFELPLLTGNQSHFAGVDGLELLALPTQND
jgi:tRNA(fMet)-specific endonuclease VapC